MQENAPAALNHIYGAITYARDLLKWDASRSVGEFRQVWFSFRTAIHSAESLLASIKLPSEPVQGLGDHAGSYAELILGFCRKYQGAVQREIDEISKLNGWPSGRLVAKALHDARYQIFDVHASPEYPISPAEFDHQLRRAWEGFQVEIAATGDTEQVEEFEEIPPEFRTKPITKKLAAKCLGKENEDSGVRWLSECIEMGLIRCEKMSRQAFVFDLRQFPKESHSKLKPSPAKSR